MAFLFRNIVRFLSYSGRFPQVGAKYLPTKICFSAILLSQALTRFKPTMQNSANRLEFPQSQSKLCLFYLISA